MKIHSVKTKPVVMKAVQFTGKNGKDVAKWINEGETAIAQVARNGGGWISLTTDGDVKNTVRKGDVIIYNPEHGGWFNICPIRVFQEDFNLTKLQKEQFELV